MCVCVCVCARARACGGVCVCVHDFIGKDNDIRTSSMRIEIFKV